MELKRSWMMLAVILVVVLSECKSSNACLDHEKIALLKLQTIFYSPRLDWVESDHNSDCCQWQGVVCDNSTMNVIELHLLNARDHVSGEVQTELYVNFTLFLPFEKLRTLDLSYNGITGFVEDEGFERLSQLENLDLSENNLNNSIVSSLSALPSLKSLSLSDNNLQGALYLEDFNNFVSLKSLDLSFNRIEEFKSVKANVKQLTLSNLVVLDLSHNLFDNSILRVLNGLTSLKSLNLNYNQLNGSIYIQDVLLNLEELHLSGTAIKEFVTLRGDKSYSKLKVLHLESVDTDKNILLQSLGSTFPLLRTLNLGYNILNQTTSTLKLDNLTNLKELFLDRSTLDANLFRSMDVLSSLKTLSFNSSELHGPLIVQDLPNFNKLEFLDISITTLNSSFLQTIGEMDALKVLRLAESGFNGSLSLALGLCKLRFLEELDLSGNNLVGDLPACLANLTLIQTLDLSRNQFTGNISPLTSLTSLQELTLNDNHFQIPISLGPFYNHSKLMSFVGDNNVIYADDVPQSLAPKFQLNTISLSCCGDVGAFPQFLYHQHDLTIVVLSDIYLKGKFPNWLLDNNPRLFELYLNNNSLSGPLDLPVHSHMYLSSLYISDNLLDSKIPVEFGKYFPKLEYLRMGSNRFIGNIPSSFGYMRLLRGLDLSNNQLFGKIPEDLGNCKSLGYIRLSNNSLQGPIPKWMGNLSYLRDLRMASNHLKGPIPAEFCHLTNLVTLDLSDNDIFGTLDVIFSNSSSIIILDLSNNQLFGNIPSSFGYMRLLNWLDLSNNQLFGNIPSSFGYMRSLAYLDLSNNQLFGKIPEDLGKGCTSLGSIRLSNNSLQGPIPKWMGNLSYLSELRMTSNHLKGPIPAEFCHLTKLHTLDLSYNDIFGTLDVIFSNSSSINILDLSNNHLTGRIPHEIKRLPDLLFLFLSNNHLEGEVPIELCRLEWLSWLDLSHNDLFGTIPKCLHVTIVEEANIALSEDYLIYLAYEGVVFKTKWMSYLYQGKILEYMSGIDLSCNNFSGKIPSGIGNLSSIRTLNLSHNSLVGQIPKTFGNLKEIESMDLSNNFLSGNIPQELVALNFLAVFSVVSNNLSGEVPTTGQFGGFIESSYEGNPLLCGRQLRRNCRAEGSGSTTSSTLVDHGDDDGFMDMTAFYASLTTTYLVAILGLALVLVINPYWRQWWFYHIEKWTNTCYYFVVDNFPKRRQVAAMGRR